MNGAGNITFIGRGILDTDTNAEAHADQELPESVQLVLVIVLERPSEHHMDNGQRLASAVLCRIS